MKQLLILALALAMLFSLVSCDRTSEKESTEASTAEQTETPAPESTEAESTEVPSESEPSTHEAEENPSEEDSETESESASVMLPTCTEAPAPVCAHKFSEPTCTDLATCEKCGEVQGEKLAHEYSEATCTARPTCIHCGKERGRNLGHKYEDGKCIRCEAPDPYGIKTEGITRVAFVGDSITAGGYWKNASTHLGNKFEYDGFGVSGSTAYAQGLDGNPPVPLAYVDQPAYKKSLQYNPDVVVIMLGTNDSKSMNADRIKEDGGEQYKQDVTAMVEAYKALADHPQVFIALPPYSYRPENGGISNVNIETLIIPLLESVAEATGAIVIDTHTASANANEAFPDGVHPNDDGKALLVEAVTAAILAWSENTDTETP